MMEIRWHKLLGKFTIWLTLEIVLNLMGLDDIADYSEFIFERGNSPVATVNVYVTSAID